MLSARQGWIDHTEILLFCMSAGENIVFMMQHFFIQKSYLFYS